MFMLKSARQIEGGGAWHWETIRFQDFEVLIITGSMDWFKHVQYVCVCMLLLHKDLKTPAGQYCKARAETNHNYWISTKFNVLMKDSAKSI